MDEKLLNLTNSVYRLLESFPDNDADIKERIREKVLSIMEGLVLAFAEDFDKNQIANNIDILLGYLKIAKEKMWIQQTNYLIICTEYKKIKRQFKPCVQKAPKSVVKKVRAQKKDVSVSFKFSERQQRIIDFLKENQKGQVMDIQQVLPSVTKRTIRRDLDSLMESGAIIRMGEFNQVFYRISVRT